MKRGDYQNELIAKLYKECDEFEKLNIEPMLKNHSLAKSISDSSWDRFIAKARYKADMLGKYFIAVDAAGTTQLLLLNMGSEGFERKRTSLPQLWCRTPRDLR